MGWLPQAAAAAKAASAAAARAVSAAARHQRLRRSSGTFEATWLARVCTERVCTVRERVLGPAPVAKCT